MPREGPLNLALLVGGFAIRHIIAALMEHGYKRLQNFVRPVILWVDLGNNEENRYMKYLPNWNAIVKDQIQQIIQLGWPENLIITDPFKQELLWEVIGDFNVHGLYGQMHGGIIGPTAIRLVKKRFLINHPALELPLSKSGKFIFQIPTLSRGAGAPERLVSVFCEDGKFYVLTYKNGKVEQVEVPPRFQMVLIRGIRAIRGNPLSLDSGPIKFPSPTSLLRVQTKEEALDLTTMPRRIAEFMECASVLSAQGVRNDVVHALLNVEQARKRGLNWELGTKLERITKLCSRSF